MSHPIPIPLFARIQKFFTHHPSNPLDPRTLQQFAEARRLAVDVGEKTERIIWLLPRKTITIPPNDPRDIPSILGIPQWRPVLSVREHNALNRITSRAHQFETTLFSWMTAASPATPTRCRRILRQLRKDSRKIDRLLAKAIGHPKP